MEEKTLFKLARAITDTGTDTVSSKGGTVTYRITSLKRKLVNGKVVSTSTPYCTLGSASISGYLMIHGLDGSVTMNIPVTVNLSSYGNTTKADTGDRVTVWTSSGSSFIQIGSFTVPSAGGTVSI